MKSEWDDLFTQTGIDPTKRIAHDFYSESDQFRVIPLSDHLNRDIKSALTTSRGFVMYIKTLAQKENNLFKCLEVDQ